MDLNTAINNLNTSKNNTIIVMDGVYTGTGNTRLNIALSNLTIKADINANPIFNFGKVTSNFLSFKGSNININGLTFTNFSNYPIFLLNTNNFRIYNSLFQNGDNVAIFISNYNNNTRIENCTFKNNNCTSYVANYGIISSISYSNNTIIVNSTFINNTASYGAIYLNYVNGTNLIENNTFINNSAKISGGALYSTTSNLEINNNYFLNNTANEYGGAIYILNSKNISLDNNTFINNTAKQGGGAYVKIAQDTLTNYCENINITNSMFIENTADIGGGLVIETPNSTVINTTFIKNTATRYGGGGLIISGENTLVDNCTFINNTGLNYAGALSTNNTLINNSKFINNTAYHGGAILTINSTIENTLFDNNNANFTAPSTYNETNTTKQTINTETILNYTNTDYTITLTDLTDNVIINITGDNINTIINTTTGKYTLEDFTDYTIINITEATIENTTQKEVTKNNISSNILALTSYTLINTTTQPNTAYTYDATRILDVVDDINGRYYLNDTNHLITHIGYCVEENASAPYNIIGSINGTSGIEIQNLSFIRNSLDQSYVGDYLKILIAYYQPFIFNLKEEVLIFTDGNYTNSTNTIVQDVIKKYNNGTRVNNGQEVLINDTVSCYYFSSFINPTTRQNLILINACSGVLIKPELNVTKKALTNMIYSPNTTIVYNISVKNNNTYTMHNVTVFEKIIGPMRYYKWECNSADYHWIFYESNLTWCLNKSLEANEEASFLLYMNTTMSNSYFNSASDVVNYVGAYSLESKTVYDEATVNISKSGILVVKTPVREVYSYKTSGSFDNRINFTISITNIGTSPISRFNITEDPENGLTLASVDSIPFLMRTGQNTLTYSGTLQPGETLKLVAYFTATYGVNKTYYNHITVTTPTGSSEDNVTVNVTHPTNSLSINKTANNKTVMVGQQVNFTIMVYNDGTESMSGFRINDTTASRTYRGYWVNDSIGDEIGLVFDHLEYDTRYWHIEGPTGTNILGYNSYILPGEYASPIIAVFNTTKSGNLTNNVTLFYTDSSYRYVNVTDNDTVEVIPYNPNMTVTKITLNNTVYIGENITFLIQVNNTGTINLTKVYVNETSFTGLNYLYYTNSSSSLWNHSANIWYLNKNLNVGETAELYITFNSSNIGNFTNIIEAGSNESNITIANNTTTVLPYIPNLTVSKITLTPNSILNGNVNFLIRVVNTGTVDLNNITVKEEFDTGLKYRTYSTTDSWTFNSSSMIWTLETLKAGSNSSIIVTFTPTRIGTLWNNVNVSSNQTNNTIANNTTTVHEETPITPEHITNLSLFKTALNQTVFLGEQVTFQLTIVNTGDTIIYDAYVNELNYTNGLVFDSFTGEDWHHEIIDGKHLFIHYNLLNPNETSSFYIRFNTTNTGIQINNAIAGFNHTDWTNASANITVNPLPEILNLSIVKICLNNTVTIGDEAIFQIIVNNTGNVNLTNVTVKEIFDEGLLLNSYSNIQGVWILEEDTFYLNNTLNVGDIASFYVTFNTTSTGLKKNTVFAGLNDTIYSNSTNFTNIINKTIPTNDTPTNNTNITPIIPINPINQTNNTNTPENIKK